MEGRLTMVRSVDGELLKQKGYGAVFKTSITDDVAQSFAKPPYHGRELKRSIEAALLSALTQVSVKTKHKAQLHIELRHLLSYKNEVKHPPRIGFMS